MHPAEEIAAFGKLNKEEGISPEEIAARFGISHMTVRRRLAPADLSPRILEELRQDNMSLEQAQALTLTPDHDRQEAAWFGSQQPWQREPGHLKRRLSEERLHPTDKISHFIRAEYLAAGGAYESDLFATKEQVYLIDKELAYSLAEQKLEAHRATVAAEGWKWIVVIRMTIDAGLTYELEGPWIELLEALSLITDGMRTANMDLAGLQEIHGALVSLKERVDNAFLRASNQQNMNPKEAQNEPHNTSYNRASSSKSNGLRRVAIAPRHEDWSAYGAEGFSRRPVSGFAGSQALSAPRPAQSDGSSSNSDSEFSLGLVMTACPRMKGFARGIDGWSDLVAAADQACHEIGINKSAWIEAREAIGEIAAATAVALIFEKRMAQECGRTGGYLRAMTSRARKGELHLARSLFGLAERNAAARAH